MNDNMRVFPYLIDKMLDNVVRVCAEKYPVCPFGCGKDGGANCHQNIKDVACQPAKDYAAARRA